MDAETGHTPTNAPPRDFPITYLEHTETGIPPDPGNTEIIIGISRRFRGDECSMPQDIAITAVIRLAWNIVLDHVYLLKALGLKIQFHTGGPAVKDRYLGGIACRRVGRHQPL